MSTSWCCSLSAPSPDGYGWTIEATDLDIKWGPIESAPDSIFLKLYVNKCAGATMARNEGQYGGRLCQNMLRSNKCYGFKMAEI
jgi:hypothetical protein